MMALIASPFELWHVARAANSASPFLWYVTRAFAVVAYGSLSIVVMVGQIRVIIRRFGDPIPWLLDEIHIFLSILTVLLVAGHLITLYFDPFLPFQLINFIVPGNQPYREIPVDLGVFALYALLALWLSSWAKKHLTYNVWRTVHFVSFAAFALVTLHGIFAGSDAGEPFMIVMYVSLGAMVIFLTIARMLVRPVARVPTGQRR